MTAPPDPVGPAMDPALADLRAEIAADLRLLAFLHGQEPAAASLDQLRQAPFQEFLGLQLRSEAADAALALLDRALGKMPAVVDAATCDALAVDYADIYLSYRYRVSPCESVWFDDDGLERQGAMFAVRQWYHRFGLGSADWGCRPEDHLVLELEFLAHLIAREDVADSLAEATRFMDAHLLRWTGTFAGQTAQRCATPYFAGLALVTAAYLDELREILLRITDEPRLSVPEPDAIVAADAARDAAR